MNVKRISLFTLMATIFLVLAACGSTSSDAESDEDSNGSEEDKGTITIGQIIGLKILPLQIYGKLY